MSARTNEVIAGTAAGLAATVPMTAVMAAWHRQLPPRQQDPLPPRQITENAAQKVGIEDDLTEAQKQALTGVAHFGFGASMGGLYGFVASPRSSAEGAAALGMAYGLGVWAASYLGWLPAAGLYRPATREPPQRNLMLVAAHLVWGGSVGLLMYWATARGACDQPGGHHE